jgi:hypothetical protein
MDNIESSGYIAWLIIVGIVAVCVIYSQLKEQKNEKLAASGEDMERLKGIVASVLPGETGYTVAYAHHEDVQHYGRSTRTTYYTYALAFDAARLWIIPLGYKKNEILPNKPYLATGNIGMVNVDTTVKNGELKSVSVVLRDKMGESPIFLEVDTLNTRKDRFHHVNILQPEECEKFSTFMASFSDTVAKENEGLEELMKEKANAQGAKSGKTLGILSLATFWIFGFVGLIFGIVGLIVSPKPSATGGKATAPFIMNLVGTILSALCMGGMLFAIIAS